jgi:hypothetical protein
MHVERQVVQPQQMVQKHIQILVDVLQWQLEEIRHVHAQQEVLKMPIKKLIWENFPLLFIDNPAFLS